MTGRSDCESRRRFLSICAGSTVAVLGGCTGVSSGPTYREGEVNETGGDQRTAEQMAAAEALAITEANRDVSTLESLALEDHEFVLEEGYKGPTVQGVVSNTGGELIELAEVRVRVYDSSGAHLGLYLARTGDLGPDTTWQFTVILLESAADIADYEIAVLGLSG